MVVQDVRTSEGSAQQMNLHPANDTNGNNNWQAPVQT